MRSLVMVGLLFGESFETGTKFEHMYPLEYMLSIDGPNIKDPGLSNIIHLIAVDSSILSQSRDLKNDENYSKVVSLLQNSIRQWSFVESQLLEPNANVAMPELYTPLRHLTTTLEVLANVHFLRQEFDLACTHLERACPLMELLPSSAFASPDAAEELSHGCFMLLREVYAKAAEFGQDLGIRDSDCVGCDWDDPAAIDIEDRLEDLRRPYVSLREELSNPRSSRPSPQLDSLPGVDGLNSASTSRDKTYSSHKNKLDGGWYVDEDDDDGDDDDDDDEGRVEGHPTRPQTKTLPRASESRPPSVVPTSSPPPLSSWDTDNYDSVSDGSLSEPEDESDDDWDGDDDSGDAKLLADRALTDQDIVVGLDLLVSTFIRKDAERRRHLAEEAQALLDDQSTRDVEGADWITLLIRAYVRLLWRCVQDGMDFIGRELIEAEEDAAADDEPYEQVRSSYARCVIVLCWSKYVNGAWLQALRVFSSALSESTSSASNHTVHSPLSFIDDLAAEANQGHAKVSGFDKEATAAMYDSPAGVIFGQNAGTPPRAAVPTVRGDALAVFAAAVTIGSLLALAAGLLGLRPAQRRKSRARVHKKAVTWSGRVALLLVPGHMGEEPPSLKEAANICLDGVREQWNMWLQDLWHDFGDGWASMFRGNAGSTGNRKRSSGRPPAAVSATSSGTSNPVAVTSDVKASAGATNASVPSKRLPAVGLADVETVSASVVSDSSKGSGRVEPHTQSSDSDRRARDGLGLGLGLGDHNRGSSADRTRLVVSAVNAEKVAKKEQKASVEADKADKQAGNSSVSKPNKKILKDIDEQKVSSKTGITSTKVREVVFKSVVEMQTLGPSSTDSTLDDIVVSSVERSRYSKSNLSEIRDTGETMWENGGDTVLGFDSSSASISIGGKSGDIVTVLSDLSSKSESPSFPDQDLEDEPLASVISTVSEPISEALSKRFDEVESTHVESMGRLAVELERSSGASRPSTFTSLAQAVRPNGASSRATGVQSNSSLPTHTPMLAPSELGGVSSPVPIPVKVPVVAPPMQAGLPQRSSGSQLVQPVHAAQPMTTPAKPQSWAGVVQRSSGSTGIASIPPAPTLAEGVPPALPACGLTHSSPQSPAPSQPQLAPTYIDTAWTPFGMAPMGLSLNDPEIHGPRPMAIPIAASQSGRPSIPEVNFGLLLQQHGQHWSNVPNGITDMNLRVSDLDPMAASFGPAGYSSDAVSTSSTASSQSGLNHANGNLAASRHQTSPLMASVEQKLTDGHMGMDFRMASVGTGRLPRKPANIGISGGYFSNDDPVALPSPATAASVLNSTSTFNKSISKTKQNDVGAQSEGPPLSFWSSPWDTPVDLTPLNFNSMGKAEEVGFSSTTTSMHPISPVGSAVIRNEDRGGHVTVSFTVLCMAQLPEDVVTVMVYASLEGSGSVSGQAVNSSALVSIVTSPDWPHTWTAIPLRRSLADPRLWGGTTRVPRVVLSRQSVSYRYVARDRTRRLWCENCAPRSLSSHYNAAASITNVGIGGAVLELEDVFLEQGAEVFE